jgi:hypothetical protein
MMSFSVFIILAQARIQGGVVIPDGCHDYENAADALMHQLISSPLTGEDYPQVEVRVSLTKYL